MTLPPSSWPDTGPARRPAPVDQAHGLRRLFAGAPACHVALVANPHVAFGSVLLERLTTTLTGLGRGTLVVDAADTSPVPAEWAALDLAAGIETLSPQLWYLAARGLPLRHVDTRGSSALWLERVAAVAPQAQALVVHADAGDLARLYPRQALRPVLLAADHPDSVTHAYAAMKLLTQRCGLMSFDLLLAAAPHSRRGARVAERLATCGERFLGASLRDWAAIDPACDVREAPCAALTRLVTAQLRVPAEAVAYDADDDPAAWPPQRQPMPPRVQPAPTLN